jgi:hypothetical protein
MRVSGNPWSSRQRRITRARFGDQGDFGGQSCRALGAHFPHQRRGRGDDHRGVLFVFLDQGVEEQPLGRHELTVEEVRLQIRQSPIWALCAMTHPFETM